MGRTTWIRNGLCLLAVLALLCMGLALAESDVRAPELSVNATAVCRGEFFEANVGAVEGADAYKVYLLDESGEMRAWAYEYEAGVFYISTAEAAPGNYTLEAVALDESENEAIGERTSIAVQVLDDSGEAGGIYFNVKHRENPSQNNFIYVSAYAPGAEYVYIDWVGFDEYAADPETPGGLNLKVWDELGTQEFYAVATYPDGTVSRTESVTVNVESLPSAGEVAITDMPIHLEEGEDFSASYSVERTGGVASELRVKAFTADNWELVYDEAIDGSGSFTIPAWQEDGDGNMYATFEAGRVYEIYVILTPDDLVHYGQGWDKRHFAVVPAAGDRVFLNIADAADEAEVERGQNVPVAISVQGATAVRLRFGEGCVDLQDWGEWEDWNQSSEAWNIQLEWSFWDKCVAYAEACFDEDPWAEDAEWFRSNSVIVNVNTNGRLATPLVALSPSVPRGELLDVRVEAWDERIEWRYAILRDADWNEIFHLDFYNDDPYLPTAQLEPGRYILNVGSGATGLDDGIAMRWFEVTEPDESFVFDENGVYWKFTSQEIETHETVTFSAYANDPDVDHIRFDIFREESGEQYDSWEGGNPAIARFSAEQADTYVFTAYLYKDGVEGPVAQSSCSLSVNAPKGDLEPVQVKLPGSLALEQPLNGTIVPVEGAEWYSLNIGYNRDGEWEWFENHKQEVDELLIDYEGYWFNETGLYCLTVGAHAPGKNSSFTDCYFVVQPEETEKVVSLSLGCETETLNCVAHTELPMVVIAPGALNVEYFGGYDWRGIDHLESEFGYTGSESFDGGDYTAMARARFEEEGEWVYSNPVIVHASMPGVLGVSELTLASNNVKRGEPLVVSFTAVENASQYIVHIVNQDGEGYGYGFEPGTHRLDTSMLEEGTYTLIVNYCGSGYAWRGVEQTFTVTGAAPEEIVTFIGADEIACSEKVLVSIYAPGANRIRIYEYEASNDEDRLYEECEGDTYTQNFNRDHPDTVRYSASVSYDEGETWSDRIEIGTLRVIESPQLDKPEIKLSSTLISEGEGIAFSFGGVENATLYSYQIRDNDVLNGRDQVMDGWFDEPAFVRLPAELFRAGHTYRLDVLVSAPGYETNSTAYSLAVRPELVDGDITLYVNGETESVEGWVSEGFHVVVDAPENARAIIVSDGFGWDWQPGNHFEEYFGYDFSGEVTLIARYTVDEIDLDSPWWEAAGWAGYSNPVTVRINSCGDMPEVEANVPASVIRGDFMDIAVTNAEAFLNGGYENLWLHAEAYSPDDDRWYGCYDWNGEGSILLPTAELMAGRTYELHVRAGADGWVGSTHVYEFSVDEPENGGPVLKIDKTEVMTGEDFTISVCAPGAVEMMLFDDYNKIDSRCGDNAEFYVQRHNHSEATTLHFHAEVLYEEDGEWVSTETIAVTFTAPYGDITEDELGLVVPARPNADEELTINWKDIGLQHYDVNIERVRDGRCVWHSWNNHGETEVNVPLTMPEEYDGMEQVLKPGEAILEAGEFYRVNLYFQRVGFNSLHVEKQIVVVSDDMYAEGLTLMVDGQTDAYTTPVNVDVPVRITAPQNATAILVWNGYGWDMYTGNEVVTTWAWGDANERLLYARYTTDEIVDGKDWPEYGWSRVSNIVSLTTTSKGNLPVVEATVPGSVMRGKPLEISVNNPAAFQGIDGLQLTAEAYFRDEDRWYGRYDWDGEGSILLPTAELWDNVTFELHVRASAPGYTESESVYEFTVDPLPEGTTIYFDVSKEEVETCEQFTISVFAPGADEVRVYGDYREIGRWEGCDFYADSHWCSEVGKMVIFARAHYNDGENDWWEQTPSIRVIVRATGEQLTEDEVIFAVPSQLAANEDLNVSWTDAGLDHYDLNVTRLSDGQNVWHSWNDHGETEMTVPAVMPEYTPENVDRMLETGEAVLEAGEAYEVTLHAYRRGSNVLHVRKQVLVVADGMFDGSITLRLSKNDVLANEDVTISVAAPDDATAILLWRGYDWEWYDGSSVETGFAWGEAGERTLYAKYTTDPNADRYSDWNEYEWSGLSNIVTVNVTRTGVVEAPVVALSSDTLLRGEKLTFTVSNADNGFNWTVYDPIDNSDWGWSDWNEAFSHEFDTFDLQGNHTYLLCVMTYGSAGYESTRVEIPFTVKTNGTADAPDVEVADSIAQGDVLTIRIKNPEAGNLFRAWFWQEETGTNFASDWNGVDTIYLPSFNLIPGVYTELYVQNDGSYGMERSLTVLTIEVTESSGEMSLCLEKTSLVTQEQTYIVAYAPGAQSIRVYAYNEGDEEHPFWDETKDGEVWQDWMNFTGESGTKYLTAVANYSDGSTQTQTVEVTVTAPEGDLPEPVITAPDTAEPGEMVTVSVYAGNAEWWFMEVRDVTDDGRLVMRLDVDNFEEHGGCFLGEDRLEEGHTYGVNVYAARYAWNSASAYREFTVGTTDDPYAENVLRLPAALNEIGFEAFEGITARTVVIPDGATTIGSRAFANCVNLKYVEIPDSVTSIAGDAFYGCDVTFICNTGSPAYAYAQDNGIPVR